MDVQQTVLTLVLGQGDLREIHRRRGRAVVTVARELFSNLDTNVFLRLLSRTTDMGRENALIDATKWRLELVVI